MECTLPWGNKKVFQGEIAACHGSDGNRKRRNACYQKRLYL